MRTRRNDASSLAALIADCPSRSAFEEAQLEWLDRAVGFDAFYRGAAEPAVPIVPQVAGVSTSFVDRCESQADRYWEDRMILGHAAARSGDAVADHDVIDRRERDKRPFYREIVAGLGIGAMATVILRARGEAVGCLFLGRTGRSSRFRSGEIDLLRAAAPILGLGVALHGADAPKHPRRIPALSPREQEVADLVCRGLTNPEIARMLGTSPRTVKNQVSSILRKTGASNRAELAGIAARLSRSESADGWA